MPRKERTPEEIEAAKERNREWRRNYRKARIAKSDQEQKAPVAEQRPSADQLPILKAVDVPLHQVEELASRGMTMHEIGYFYGLHPWSIELYRRQRPTLNEAFERGRAKGIDEATSALNLQIKRGNIAAIIFYLKTRAKWRETDRLEVTGKNGDPLKVEQIQGRIDLTKMSTDELQSILGMLVKAKAADVPPEAVLEPEEE